MPPNSKNPSPTRSPDATPRNASCRALVSLLVGLVLLFVPASAGATGLCGGFDVATVFPIETEADVNGWNPAPAIAARGGFCFDLGDVVLGLLPELTWQGFVTDDGARVDRYIVGPSAEVLYKLAPVLLGARLAPAAGFVADDRFDGVRYEETGEAVDGFGAGIAFQGSLVLWWPAHAFWAFELALDYTAMGRQEIAPESLDVRNAKFPVPRRHGGPGHAIQLRLGIIFAQ